jgi:hypothetical protein
MTQIFLKQESYLVLSVKPVYLLKNMSLYLKLVRLKTYQLSSIRREKVLLHLVSKKYRPVNHQSVNKALRKRDLQLNRPAQKREIKALHHVVVQVKTKSLVS